MNKSRDEAIQCATQFANDNGYRVVSSFEGIVWGGRDTDGSRPVKFAAARLINDEWAVLFDTMLPPGIESEDPGDICVIVGGNGKCRYYPML